MEDSQSGKKAKVIDIIELNPGVIVNLKDWHITASDGHGNITIATLEVEEEKTDDSDYQIQPGAWRVTPKSGLQAVKFSNSVFYETETSAKLRKIFNTFKNNLHVYDELDIAIKKRGVLIGSKPGVGKTSLINNLAAGMQKEKNICILYVDSPDVSWELMQTMFRKKSEGVDFIVLVIEDIGGSNLDEYSSNVSSTLLNFLDGADGVFTVPTLVIGTTNYIDLLQDSITSRPGRFDIVVELSAMGEKETILFAENFIKRELTDSEKKAISSEGFTAAYVKEAVVRHRLDDITLEESVAQIRAQRKLSEEKVHKQRRGRRTTGFHEGN